MGFLDRARKLAEQAKDKAGDALDDVRARGMSTSASSSPPAGERDPRWGTAYVPGMLGRQGWRERGLADPAAVLPVDDRDRAGVPHSTKSEIVEEPFGMGRRWSSGGRSIGLFYRLYPEQQGWAPPGSHPAGSSPATLVDGRSLVFLGEGDRRVVLETSGIDDATRAALARVVTEHLD